MSDPIHHLLILQSLVLLRSSRPLHMCHLSYKERSLFYRRYESNLPSSFAVIHFTPFSPPVSVWGTVVCRKKYFQDREKQTKSFHPKNSFSFIQPSSFFPHRLSSFNVCLRDRVTQSWITWLWNPWTLVEIHLISLNATHVSILTSDRSTNSPELASSPYRTFCYHLIHFLTKSSSSLLR